MKYECDFHIGEIVFHVLDGQKGMITAVYFGLKGTTYQIQWSHNTQTENYEFEITRDRVFESN